MCADELIFK